MSKPKFLYYDYLMKINGFTEDSESISKSKSRQVVKNPNVNIIKENEYEEEEEEEEEDQKIINNNIINHINNKNI